MRQSQGNEGYNMHRGKGGSPANIGRGVECVREKGIERTLIGNRQS